MATSRRLTAGRELFRRLAVFERLPADTMRANGRRPLISSGTFHPSVLRKDTIRAFDLLALPPGACWRAVTLTNGGLSLMCLPEGIGA